MAGLIKSVLALYYKIFPPTLCDEPDPEINKTSLYLNTETKSWIHGKPHPRRAGVNSFGFGGINSHAILEEYTKNDSDKRPSSLLKQWDSEVIIIQAESRKDLIAKGERLLNFIIANPYAALKDVAYTLNCPLDESTKYRLDIVAGSFKDLEKKLVFSLKRLADLQCSKIRD